MRRKKTGVEKVKKIWGMPRATVLVILLFVAIIAVVVAIGGEMPEPKTEYSPPTLTTSSQPLSTEPLHTSREVNELVEVTMQRLFFSGKVLTTTFNPDTRTWLVLFEVRSRTGDAHIEITVLDATLEPDKVAFLLPVPPVTAVKEGNDPAFGPADAPVTMIMFSDFDCDKCHDAYYVINQLLEDYPDDLRLVYKNYAVQGMKAAEASECAYDQGKFWEYWNKLYQEKEYDVDALKKYAKELGLVESQFIECLDSDEKATEIALDFQEGHDANVNRIPTFFINTRMFVGYGSYDQMKSVIDDELLPAND